MNDYIYLGTITSTHGIKGELKVKSDFEFKDRCFKKGFNIYIDNKSFSISSYREHKQFDLITIDNMLDINLINQYIGKEVYILKSDLKLKDNEFLYQDLINCEIIDNKKSLGTVRDLRKTNIILLEIDFQPKYFIPLVDEYIEKVDIQNKKIYTKGAEELIL